MHFSVNILYFSLASFFSPTLLLVFVQPHQPLLPLLYYTRGAFCFCQLLFEGPTQLSFKLFNKGTSFVTAPLCHLFEFLDILIAGPPLLLNYPQLLYLLFFFCHLSKLIPHFAEQFFYYFYL